MGEVYGFSTQSGIRRVVDATRKVEESYRSGLVGNPSGRRVVEGEQFFRVTDGSANAYGECDAEPVWWDAVNQVYKVLGTQTVKLKASFGSLVEGNVYLAKVQGRCHDESKVLFVTSSAGGAGSFGVFSITGMSGDGYTGPKLVFNTTTHLWEDADPAETITAVPVPASTTTGFFVKTDGTAKGIYFSDGPGYSFIPWQYADDGSSNGYDGLVKEGNQWLGYKLSTKAAGNFSVPFYGQFQYQGIDPSGIDNVVSFLGYGDQEVDEYGFITGGSHPPGSSTTAVYNVVGMMRLSDGGDSGRAIAFMPAWTFSTIGFIVDDVANSGKGFGATNTDVNAAFRYKGGIIVWLKGAIGDLLYCTAADAPDADPDTASAADYNRLAIGANNSFLRSDGTVPGWGGLTSTDVTDALGFTPADATNTYTKAEVDAITNALDARITALGG